MKRIILIIAIIFLCIIGIYFFGENGIEKINGENIKNSSDKNVAGENYEDGVINTLNTFNSIANNKKPSVAKKFIDENIDDFSQLDADIIITMYIENLRKYQKIYAEKIFTWEYQIALLDAYDKSYNLDKIGKDYSDEIKEYLYSMQEDGFLLSYNEGIISIFPDYGGLKEYNTYLSESIKDYIDIISRESSEEMATDTEIKITWDELSYRVLNTEKYIDEYPDSIKYDEVYDLYLLYLKTFLSGFNDTAIYYWNTKMIRNDVLQVYNKTIIHNKSTFTAKTLSNYMEIIEKNDNKVEEGALNYVSNIVDRLSSSRKLQLKE